jgi:hypothetical protein
MTQVTKRDSQDEAEGHLGSDPPDTAIHAFEHSAHSALCPQLCGRRAATLRAPVSRKTRAKTCKHLHTSSLQLACFHLGNHFPGGSKQAGAWRGQEPPAANPPVRAHCYAAAVCILPRGICQHERAALRAAKASARQLPAASPRPLAHALSLPHHSTLTNKWPAIREHQGQSMRLPQSYHSTRLHASLDDIERAGEEGGGHAGRKASYQIVHRPQSLFALPFLQISASSRNQGRIDE